ncbi:MAG: cytidine deaminase [Alphaproteobacteria bacterium]|jgi:cytidine deaminase|nr:cytidine deaminase [Alphaproteobacteria bacterium]
MSGLAEHVREELIAAAREACAKAYAPYSKFRVGAAVLTQQGHIYQGCNVENGAYPLCVCAERNAIARAVIEEGPTMSLKAIAIINMNEQECTPCGGCRQVISEFGKSTTVLYVGGQGWTETPLYTLLPGVFDFMPEV